MDPKVQSGAGRCGDRHISNSMEVAKALRIGNQLYAVVLDVTRWYQSACRSTTGIPDSLAKCDPIHLRLGGWVVNGMGLRMFENQIERYPYFKSPVSMEVLV